MSILVRPVEPRDREAWARLFVDYGVFYETVFDQGIVDGVWAWLLDDAIEVYAYVATRDDAVIGFANHRRLLDTFVAGPAWFLDDLYVEPGHRGSGAATALIEAVAARATADGGRNLRWTTAPDNATAQRVYDRLAKRTPWLTYEMDL